MKTHSTPLLNINVAHLLKILRTKHYLSHYPSFVQNDKKWKSLLRYFARYFGMITHIDCIVGMRRGSHVMWATFANGRTIQIDDELNHEFMICDIASDDDPIFIDK